MSITGLKFGEHIADIIIQKHKIQFGKLYHVVEKPSKLDELIIPDFISLGFGVASIVLVVALTSTMQINRGILFATVFAPIGTYILITYSTNFLGYNKYFVFFKVPWLDGIYLNIMQRKDFFHGELLLQIYQVQSLSEYYFF